MQELAECKWKILPVLNSPLGDKLTLRVNNDLI